MFSFWIPDSSLLLSHNCPPTTAMENPTSGSYGRRRRLSFDEEEDTKTQTPWFLIAKIEHATEKKNTKNTK
ncbi:hypothetical protein KCU90_g201, partial [Aureobasidium melanogenum]